MNRSLNTKNARFNLIKKKIEIREKVEVERDWYSLLNLLLISIVIIASIIAYLVRLNMETRLNEKKETVVSLYNNTIASQAKVIQEGKINAITGKYSQYQNLKAQNFNLDEFYEDIYSISPDISIDNFSVQPDSDFVDLTINFKDDGYDRLGEILSLIENNERFKNSRILEVSFSLPSTYSVNNSSDSSTLPISDIFSASNSEIPNLFDSFSNRSELITIIKISVNKDNNQEEI